MTTLRLVHCEVAPVSIAPGSRACSPGRTVAWSAAVFAASFLACCWIAPAGLGGNGGLSDFGGHLTTFVPYWVGLWTLALGLWRAAGSQPDPVERVLLRLVGVLVAVVVFMFSALGPLLAAAHVVVGAAAFTLSLVVSAYGTCRPGTAMPACRRVLARCSLAVEMLAWSLAALWLFEVRGYLLWAQFAFFVAFLMNAMTWLRGVELVPSSDAP